MLFAAFQRLIGIKTRMRMLTVYPLFALLFFSGHQFSVLEYAPSSRFTLHLGEVDLCRRALAS